MSAMNKTWVLFFVFMMLSSLIVLTAKSMDVQAEAKPAVPEFTLKLVDKPYIMAPIQTTDPYTGVTITQPGYQVENKVVEITIKNQNYPDLMYSVRAKGHFEQEWRITHGYNGAEAGFTYQSDGKYTVIELPTKHGWYTEIYPDGAQIDIQVEALHGRYVRRPTPGNEWYIGEFFEGVTSDWSKTRTITVTYGSSSSSSSQAVTLPENSTITLGGNQTDYPQSNEFMVSIKLLLGVIIVFIVVIVALVVALLKRFQPQLQAIS
ncbi:MAG: hypothetical protein FWC14_06980 [Candidatus Bathyarchaeota archaeon]|uniref:hypothetical protein n=2 Tax=Candidatus Bathycorpusculum sp. TaxID=2994959 RepID=UPI0028305F76|nr:hypothetical protein [Candidatus Termiticorpusculum sp.]MCL2291948.1 hypothetical protein [Candidatus Termiticorpusculum sp.]